MKSCNRFRIRFSAGSSFPASSNTLASLFGSHRGACREPSRKGTTEQCRSSPQAPRPVTSRTSRSWPTEIMLKGGESGRVANAGAGRDARSIPRLALRRGHRREQRIREIRADLHLFLGGIQVDGVGRTPFSWPGWPPLSRDIIQKWTPRSRSRTHWYPGQCSSSGRSRSVSVSD